MAVDRLFREVCSTSERSVAALALTVSIATAMLVWPASTVALDITLIKNADLSFGELIAGGPGTVVITPAGARSATGGVTLGNSAGATAAAFTVGGDPSASYSITLPASTILTSGPNTMTVDNFASTPSGNGTMSGGGSQSLTVGATLQVGANQASGSYSGSFSVTVTYN